MPQRLTIPALITLGNGNQHLVSILNLRGAKDVLFNLAIGSIAISKMQLHPDRLTTSIHTRLMDNVVSGALIGIIPLLEPNLARTIVSAIFLGGSLHISKGLVVFSHHLIIVVNTNIHSIAQVVHSLIQIHPGHYARSGRHRRRRATRLTHSRLILGAERRKLRRRARRRALRRHRRLTAIATRHRRRAGMDRRLTAIATRFTRHRIIQIILHFNIPP